MPFPARWAAPAILLPALLLAGSALAGQDPDPTGIPYPPTEDGYGFTMPLDPDAQAVPPDRQRDKRWEKHEPEEPPAKLDLPGTPERARILPPYYLERDIWVQRMLDPDRLPRERVEYIDRLRETGDRHVIPAAMEALRDPVEEVRRQAGFLLVELAGKPEVSMLIELLNHDHPEVRRRANARLRELTYHYFGPVDLIEERRQTQARWVRWWEEEGNVARQLPPNSPIEIEMPEDMAPDMHMYKGIIEGSMESLPRELRDFESIDVGNALERLERLGVPITVEVLVQKVRGGSQTEMCLAAVVLAEIGEQTDRVLEPLLANVDRDQQRNPTVRAWTAYALGVLGHPRAIGHLVEKGLTDPNGNVRDFSLRALQQLTRRFMGRDRTLGLQWSHYPVFADEHLVGWDFRDEAVAAWQRWWEENRDTILEIKYHNIFFYEGGREQSDRHSQPIDITWDFEEIYYLSDEELQFLRLMPRPGEEGEER